MSNLQRFVQDFICFYRNVKSGCYTDVVAQIELEKLHDKACKSMHDKPFDGKAYDPCTERVLDLTGKKMIKMNLNVVKKLGEKIRKNKRSR